MSGGNGKRQSESRRNGNYTKWDDSAWLPQLSVSKLFICVFVRLRLYVPVNNFPVILGRLPVFNQY